MEVLKIIILFALSCASSSTSVDTMEESATANSAQLESAQSAAASADMGFFSVFFFDFNLNQQAYSSFMSENNMPLPQEVESYFVHLGGLSSTVNLEQDVALNFPFTPFKTFITAFPWYSTLLSEASISTLYLPQNFLSGSSRTPQAGASASQAQPTEYMTSFQGTISPTGVRSAANISSSMNNTHTNPSNTSDTYASINDASLPQWSLTFIFLALASIFV